MHSVLSPSDSLCTNRVIKVQLLGVGARAPEKDSYRTNDSNSQHTFSYTRVPGSPCVKHLTLNPPPVLGTNTIYTVHRRKRRHAKIRSPA